MSRSPSVPLDAEAVERRRRSLGKALRQQRISAQMSQETLAEKAGIDRKLISRAETGTHAPTLDALIRLAAALSVSESDLLAPPASHQGVHEEEPS